MGLGRGGSDNGGRGAGGGRDEKSIQADINRSLKESGGQWTSNLNDLVAEREAARSRGTTSGRTASGGIADLGRSIASIPGNIARDVRMGAAAGMFGAASGRPKTSRTVDSLPLKSKTTLPALTPPSPALRLREWRGQMKIAAMLKKGLAWRDSKTRAPRIRCLVIEARLVKHPQPPAARAL